MSYRFIEKTYFRIGLSVFLVFNLVCFNHLKAKATQNEITLEINTHLIEGQKYFTKARNMYYNAEAPVNEVVKLLNQSNESFVRLPEGFDKYYWSANVAYLSGEMAEVAGDKQKAALDFTASNELISKALNFNPQSSDANRVLADTMMRLMSYKGTIYMMTKGPQVLKLLNKALSMDEKNYSAMNSLGMYYIEAPAIGGGSVDKGIEVLQKALESKDEFDNFISNVWLGMAFQKKKNTSEASRYYQRALKIFPNSPWVKGLVQNL